MNKLSLALALALLVPSTISFAQPVRAARPQQPGLFSQSNIEKGWQAAKQRRQPMLVMFTSDNCKFCKKMLAETYSHPAIQQMLAANTQTVLAHQKDYPKLVKKLGVRGYPSSVLVAPNGDVLEFVEGFLPPKELAARFVPALQKHARATQVAQQPARP